MMTYFLVGHRPEESTQEIMERTREFGEARQGMNRAKAEIGTLSLTDELTGLRSRQGFAAVVEHLFSVAGRDKRRVLLALLRLDNLEQIFLEFGHESGEESLRLIAQVLLQTFRTSDLCARVGDRIFLIAGPEVTPAPTDILVQRFERAIGVHFITSPATYPLVMSGHGVAWDHTNPRSLDELLTELEMGLRTLKTL
jgi:diguanylate cyclase (GGDEF)-like protein